ncbi:MAG: polysaccharide biosynthesis C-terminal domain-containing protein, partial [Chitinophagales bacterium]
VFISAFGIRFTGHQLQILGLLILNQIFLSFYVFIRSNVSGLHLFKTDAVLSVLDKTISSILCALILWTSITPFAITISNFIWSQITGYIIAGSMGLIMLSGYFKKMRFRFQMELLKEIVRNSYPFAMLTFLMAVYYRIDGVMIERLLGENGAAEAGIYASAFRLLDALSILGLMFASILLPMFSRMLHQKEPVQQFAELNFKIMLLLSAGSGIAFIFYRQPIMEMLYVNATPYYAIIFGWLMVSFINISIVYIFGTLLTANGSMRSLNSIAITGVVLNIGLNMLLIPKMQAQGAAIATVATQIFVTAAHIITAYRILQFKIFPKVWLQVAGFISVYIILCLGITYLQFSWYYKLLISMLISLPAATGTGMLRINELKPIFHLMKKE